MTIPSLPVEPPEIEVDTPFDLRVALDEIGIEEVERGICEDTFENRKKIREAKLQYLPVYSKTGVPNGLLQVVSKDTAALNRLTSLRQRIPILTDPKDFNSDYLTGIDLLVEPASDVLAPPWVLGATKYWRAEQENPPDLSKKQPAHLPHRCNHVKSDSIRCMWWSSGKAKDSGLCRIHLRYIAKRTTEDIQKARDRLSQAAPYAVDQLETLMTEAISEQVRLKASTEILDRAGIRGGTEITATIEHTEARAPRDIINERLDNMRKADEERRQREQDAQQEKEQQLAIEDAEVIEPAPLVTHIIVTE